MNPQVNEGADVPRTEAQKEPTERVVLILVGLIGSGKSTFAEALEEHFPHFRRCNQDDLGDRRAVEELARRSLLEGFSICIDRTNFNSAQRRYWIDIAHEFPGTPVWVIVMNTPYEECAARIQRRVSHPTIKSPEQGLSVLARFASDFRPPLPEEGFDRMISIEPGVHPEPVYSHSDIVEILQRLRDSPQLHSPRNILSSPHLPISRGGMGRGRFGTLNMFWGRSSDYPPSQNSSTRSHRSRGRGGGGGRGSWQPATRGRWPPRGRNTGKPRGSTHDLQSVD
ncbi:hypothetical protein PM082_010674 [Marasmius tenuissimus]|nr:hypothetical protein PM082_010674 [Marasmius tenuissimus]